MGDAVGHRGYFGVAPQTVDRVTYVAASEFAKIVSSAVHKVPEPVADNLTLISNSRAEGIEFLGNEPVNGAVQMPVNVDAVIGWLIKDILPTEAFTSLESGSVGKHVFTPGAGFGVPYGFSVE